MVGMTTPPRCLFAVTCLLSLVTACASQTVLRTNVPGAKVFIDGSYVGTTPYTLRDTKIVGSSTAIRFESPGFAPMTVQLTRNEKLDVLACIGGVFLLVPFLWIMGYHAEHTYELGRGTGDVR
jgi:hypothetical protein